MKIRSAFRVLRSLARGGRRYGTLSYSQCGEDVIVRYAFALRGITRPSYIDVGAHHPYFLSNTALLYASGSRGINVEPDPRLFSAFLRHRRLDVNLNVGIGREQSSLEFKCMEDSTLSTFSKEEADRLIREGKKCVSNHRIAVMPLHTIVEQYHGGIFPDFLSIDVEGLELEVVEGANFATSAPKIICVETAEYSSTGSGAKRSDLMKRIEDYGYFGYADTNLNTIYVRRDFWGEASR